MKLTCSVDEIRRLRPEETKEILDNDTTGAFQLLDVREPYEYEAGHIPGAKWIPLSELEYRQGELDRAKTIITYCRSGHRSMAASILLCGLGFRHIYTLDGGILNWHYAVLKGIPEERPELIAGGEDVGDILLLALTLENGAFNFYIKAQETITDRNAVQTFQKLAGVEEQHIKRLYERYGQLPNMGSVPPLDQLKRESLYMEGGVKMSEELVKLGERTFMDDFEAFEIALENEYLSFDFYKRVAELVSDRKVRSLLYELAGEERGHANTLLKQIEKPVGGGHP